MKTNSVVNFSSIRLGCQNCGLENICMPDNDIIKHNHQFSRGEHLYRINDEFKTVYAIRTGSVKTYTSIETGQEQITGFHLPGELLGLESISTSLHAESAIALESSVICEIPFARLEDLSHNRPSLQHAILNAMSEEIQHDHRQLTLVSRMPAESRLASFLLTISHHFKKQGLSATDFHLSMTRSDIANLLGLAVETISRLFSQFQYKGILAVERKHIVLLDTDELMRLAHHIGDHQKPVHYTVREKAS